MDAAFEKFSSQRGDPKERRAAQQAFEEDLRKGNWEEAEKRLEAIGRAAADPITSNGRVRIEVLRVLSDEQREKLVAENPVLLRQHWSPRMNWAPQERLRKRQGKAARPGASSP